MTQESPSCSAIPSDARWLVALPVYNEAAHVAGVLAEVHRYATDVLVVDDGSTDATPQVLESIDRIQIVRHATNRGYGAALRTAFAFASREGYDVIVTIDCDGQHEPKRVPEFVAASRQADIVSGSRYLRPFPGDTPPPADRRKINAMLTAELNSRLGLELTDAFCGFKAYRVPALAKLELTEDGYGMPLELWVEAARAGLSIVELPVPLIYLEEERSFGGALDQADRRLAYYRRVLDTAMARGRCPDSQALCGGTTG